MDRGFLCVAAMLLQYNTFNNPIAVVFANALLDAAARRKGSPQPSAASGDSPVSVTAGSPDKRAASPNPSPQSRGSDTRPASPAKCVPHAALSRGCAVTRTFLRLAPGRLTRCSLAVCMYVCANPVTCSDTCVVVVAATDVTVTATPPRADSMGRVRLAYRLQLAWTLYRYPQLRQYRRAGRVQPAPAGNARLVPSRSAGAPSRATLSVV